jgi:hypothetical protein
MMSRILPAVTGLVLVVACGVVHGIWTDRWDLSNEPKASAAKLDDVSRVLGDWESLREREQLIPQDALAIGEIAGYLNRGYLNTRLAKGLGVLCVCGRPGPIGQHPPTVCFQGEGFELKKQERLSIPYNGAGKPAEFWVGEFVRNGSGGPEWERVYWSWSSTGDWLASNNPRLTFARYRALYKLYVIHKMSRPDEPAEEDPSTEFLKLLLPELHKSLFSRG